MTSSSGVSGSAVVILGVDTAIRKTGYAVLRVNGPGRFTALDCGVIRNAPNLPHSECLRRIAGGIRELISAYHPTAASIEGAFFYKNAATAMILSLARGAAITALAEAGVPVYEYSPKTAKRAAVGRGEASKEQVAAMMAAQCGLNIKDVPNDSTDALALAACHANATSRPELGSLCGKKI